MLKFSLQDINQIIKAFCSDFNFLFVKENVFCLAGQLVDSFPI